MRSPLVWFGGKGRLASKLLPLIPKHKTYVEAFGGGASLLFAKQPSLVEVYNDLDSGLVNFYRVLRDPAKFERFHQLCQLTPVSREEFFSFRENWEQEADDVERAHRWYMVARLSFSGIWGNSWSFGVTDSRCGKGKNVNGWLSVVEMLPAIHSRIIRVQIEHNDWEHVFDTYDTPGTFFYLDPPYVPETRKGGGYACEMKLEDHVRMVEKMLALQGKCMLSGYAHDVYKPLEGAGWQRQDWQVVCDAAGKTRAAGLQGKGSTADKQARVETIWMNYTAEHNGNLLDELMLGEDTEDDC